MDTNSLIGRSRSLRERLATCPPGHAGWRQFEDRRAAIISAFSWAAVANASQTSRVSNQVDANDQLAPTITTSFLALAEEQLSKLNWPRAYAAGEPLRQAVRIASGIENATVRGSSENAQVTSSLDVAPDLACPLGDPLSDTRERARLGMIVRDHVGLSGVVGGRALPAHRPVRRGDRACHPSCRWPVDLPTGNHDRAWALCAISRWRGCTR